MTFLKRLEKEIKKIIPIRKHILYNQYADFPLLKNCNSEWLKENFKEWENQDRFIPGLYNLIRFMPKDITLEEFKKHLYNVDNSFNFNKSYFNYISRNDRYYAIKIKGITNPWSDFIIEIYKKEDAEKKITSGEELISLSRLKEYEMERPNMVVYDGIFNDADKKTTRELIRQKLLIKPIGYEKEIFRH